MYRTKKIYKLKNHTTLELFKKLLKIIHKS